MSSKLSHYPNLVAIRSSLFRNPPDAVPPTDELESLHAELKVLRLRTLERAKKAGEDLRTIEESMRRMKEREKGKARAIEKVKREQDSTPFLDTDDPRGTPSSLAGSRMASQPLGSVPASSRPSIDPRKLAGDETKKKKKKRKRETEDSDAELERPRKATPPQHTIPHIHPPKASKPTPGLSLSHPKPITGPDFTIPPPSQLIPPHPPIPTPPVPGPSKPSEVMEDFSKLKQPSQVVINTFYTSIEPWIRNIKEEDVGFLEFTADEVEPYIMPKLGRHYADVWEEEDNMLYGGLLPGVAAARVGGTQGVSAPVPKWDPSTLMESDLLTEEKGHGPLTERLISALLPTPDVTVWKGVKAAEDAMEGRPGGSGAAAARKEKMNVSDLEERIRDTMRFYGLLNGVPDYSGKVDDPIATALRHAQRKLRTIVATNKARKARLTAIARDRLGYQEYLDLRDSIDKNIWSAYTKLQKKDLPKLSKKKKKVVEVNGNVNGNVTNGTGVPAPSPAALGFITDDECKLSLSDSLNQLVETRRQWVDAVGGVFETQDPGRIWGLPKRSIYEGIEEDVKCELERSMLVAPNAHSDPRTTNSKENGNASDGMDVG